MICLVFLQEHFSCNLGNQLDGFRVEAGRSVSGEMMWHWLGVMFGGGKRVQIYFELKFS